MKKIYYIILCLFLVNVTLANEIAVVNLDEIAKSSIAMEKANKTLEKRKIDVEKKLKAEEKKLSEEKESLESSIKTLSKEVAQEKITKFQDKVLEFQKKVKDEETKLQKDYSNVLIEVTNNIKLIIAEMREEKDSKYKFNIAIPASYVLYNVNTIDISAEVLLRLNKKLKEVKTLN